MAPLTSIITNAETMCLLKVGPYAVQEEPHWRVCWQTSQ